MPQPISVQEPLSFQQRTSEKITPSASASQETQASTGAQQAESQATGSISGKVIDQSGVAIAGAKVQLTRDDPSIGQELLTDEDGQFSLSNLAPGPYQLTISSPDLTPQTIEGVLHPGENNVLPLVMLAVATQVTEVRVGITPAEEAEMEVKDEEKQRMFGVIPNFFVSYSPHPVPLSRKQKFELAWKSSSDPFTLGAIGVVAGIEQAGNQWKGYGQGLQGYAKRYGASYADVFAGTFVGSAALPSLFKQDPRYFYKGSGNKKSRLLHAIAGAIICKGDNGNLQPNYSNVLGAAAAGSLSSLYYPADHRSAGRIVLSTTLIRIGETAIANIFQEFVSPKVTPNLPDRSPGQP